MLYALKAIKIRAKETLTLWHQRYGVSTARAELAGLVAAPLYHGHAGIPRDRATIVQEREFARDFVSAVKSCFAQYAGFSGRAPRSEFWWFALFQLGVLVIATMISQVLYGIAALALLLPALAVGARRLHDIGRSGWWQLLSLTGIGTLVLIYWWVQPSGE